MGTIAGGGLGDLAIRYGYQEYHPKLMTIVLIFCTGWSFLWACSRL